MALGQSGIASVREDLALMEQKIEQAKQNRQELINLASDPNFQKFAEDTNKGREINEQIQELTEWIDKMCVVLDSMKNSTKEFLNEQETING